ncbi:unnamed protein product [Diamesa serratosioi]
MSSRGRCIASDGDKFLLVNDNNCKRCVVIYEKHTNVLQYKESEYNRELLSYLCDEIPGDAMLFSMFKINPVPIKCPIKGPYAFTYNRGHGECKNPVSKIKSCTEDHRMMLNFQACPDVEGTESTVEELTCLAAWKDGNAHYIVGLLTHSRAITNDERYRCFVYEKINANSGKHVGLSKDVEYRLAQSGDASCNGLESAEVGSRIMTLKKSGPLEHCDFPKWFKEPKHWHSLNGEVAFSVHQKNDGTIHITKEKPTSYLESRAVCEQINKQTQNETMMVVEQTTGCQTGFICLMLYRRDTHVVELQMGPSQLRLEDACAPEHFDVARLPFVTLLAANPETSECPLSGAYSLLGPLGPPYLMSRHKRNHITNKHHHNSTPFKKHDSLSFRNGETFEQTLHPHERFNNQRHRRDLSKCTGTHKMKRRLSIGCSKDSIVEVHPQCSENEYNCHGAWTENHTTYIIARHAGTKHGVCLTFKQSTTDSTTAQLIVGDSCYRDSMSSEIPEHHLISNVTGKCGDTSSSSTLSNYSLLISLASWILLTSFTTR